MRITLLAWSRQWGGAERQLVNLGGGLVRRGHDVRAIVFFPSPHVEAALRGAGVPYRVLGVRGRWDAGRYLGRLLRELGRAPQDLVYAQLPFPNLLTVGLRLLDRRTRIVWGIRTTRPSASADPLAALIARAEGRLSPVASLAIANSRRARDDAVRLGFDREAVVVIPNGIDTDAFRPDPEGGARVRAEWGLAPGEPVVTLVGRLAAMKDHETFVRAAALAAGRRPDLRFACVGGGPRQARDRLEAHARELGVADRLVWAGYRGDMPAVYAAADVTTLTSAFGEGFPNAVAEALACGRPCVATDVGDTARILDGLGWIVPPGDPGALAAGWLEALAAGDGSDLRARRRRRIEERYGLERMVDRTEQALTALLGPGG